MSPGVPARPGPAARAVIWLERLWHDVRHGARIFAKNPAFTAIAVLSIAFGTGANVAIFSVVDAMLLRPLPAPRPGELLSVGTDVQRGKLVFKSASFADYLDIRGRTTTFGGLLAFEFVPVGITTRGGQVPKVRFATMVSSNFFEVLEQPPAIGRGFPSSFDAPDGREHAEVVLSHSFWKAEFSGDPGVLGRTIRIASIEFTIVGVAPEAFTGLHAYVRDNIFVPITMWSRLASYAGVDPLKARDFRHLDIKGRLAPGRTITDARAELSAIGTALAATYPATNRNQQFAVQTELEHRMHQRPLDSALMLVLSILSVGVLGVACANVAGLLASRTPVRAREMALRLAVGASRGRLMLQLLTESLGIAIAGVGGGLVVGRIGMALMSQIQFPTDMAAPPPMEMNERALVFSFIVAAASALLVGFGPAIQMTRVNPGGGLRTTETSTNRRGRLAGRSLLVAVQVALSLVLVTISVYAISFFKTILEKGPGIRTSHMAIAAVDPGQARYDEPGSARFFGDLLERARQIPGVESASVASAMPMFSWSFVTFVPEGFRPPDGQFGVSVWSNSVGDAYFETLGIARVRGRGFAPTDTADAPPVAIINSTLARHFWPDADPLGKRFGITQDDLWIEVIGVVETSALMFPGEIPQEAVYFPYRQQPRSRMTILVATRGDSASLLAPLRTLVMEADPAVPISDIQTMEAFYDSRATSFGRVMTRLVGAMGVMGVALTMVGLYGLVSYAVSRRTREIGIRIAIGATSARILAMMLRQGMRPAWVGLAAGLPLTLGTIRLMEQLSPFIYSYEYSNFLIAGPVMLVVTALAAFVPARRAAAVDPTVALRCE